MAATSANVRRQGYHEVIVHLSNSKHATFFAKNLSLVQLRKNKQQTNAHRGIAFAIRSHHGVGKLGAFWSKTD